MSVYTEVDDDALRVFVAQYDLGEVLSFKGIAEGIENSNFMLTTERGQFILTLYEKRVTRAQLPFFIGLMDHLAGEGITCPTPVRRRDGEAIGELCGRPAAIVTFLNGMWPRRIEPFHCARLGRAMARLHRAGTSFPMTRCNELGPRGWPALFEACRARAGEVAPGLADDLAGEIAYLEGAWPDGLPKGVIHADLFPDNVFFLGQELSGIIDFYFACTDFLAYDVAICINAWCFEPDHSFNVTKARQLVANYRAERDLSAAELAALPIFCRGSAVRFLLTRLYDWLHPENGALVKPKDPLEYLKKLHFHRAGGEDGLYLTG